MDENKATEIAYKNGYSKGSKDAFEKCKSIVKAICEEHNCLMLSALIENEITKRLNITKS